jgi:hypothetical protein
MTPFPTAAEVFFRGFWPKNLVASSLLRILSNAVDGADSFLEFAICLPKK